MKSGKGWVLGILGFGLLLALGAILYWRRPETRVLWSFTQIHTSLVRSKKEQAGSFVATDVSWGGRTLRREEFLAEYRLPAESGRAAAAPCPARPEHWNVRLRDLEYCFRPEGGLWKLHRIGAAPCDCR